MCPLDYGSIVAIRNCIIYRLVWNIYDIDLWLQCQIRNQKASLSFKNFY